VDDRIGPICEAICVRVVNSLQQRSFRQIPQADRIIVTAGDEASAVGGERERAYFACVSLQGVHEGEVVGDAVQVDFRIATVRSKR